MRVGASVPVEAPGAVAHFPASCLFGLTYYEVAQTSMALRLYNYNVTPRSRYHQETLQNTHGWSLALTFAFLRLKLTPKLTF